MPRGSPERPTRKAIEQWEEWERLWGAHQAELDEAEMLGFDLGGDGRPPEITPALALVFRCFSDTLGDRSSTGVTPFASVAMWCELSDLDPFWMLDRIRMVEAAIHGRQYQTDL